MTARKPKRPQPPPEKPKRLEFETFRDVRDRWSLDCLQDPEPSCFNGYVWVQKFRVIIEVVEEPVEVVGARLQKLWEETTNYHHHGPLKATAAQIGYELQGSMGAKKRGY